QDSFGGFYSPMPSCFPRAASRGEYKSDCFSRPCDVPLLPVFSGFSETGTPMGTLNTFPLSYIVKGKKIIIVGGTDEALNKARLASKTTSQVVIISRRIGVDFSAHAQAVYERPLSPADFDDAALVFVTEEGEDAELAKAEARRRGIPLNVVDVPAECDFYTPSIVDRAPLTVAISTEGDAPVLARLVRARIEAMLSPSLGKIASLAGRLRHQAAPLTHDNAA